MPRCERWLYENFLAAQMGTGSAKQVPNLLPQVVLIGNSFSVFANQAKNKPGTSASSVACEDREDDRQSYLTNHTEVIVPVKKTEPYWLALCGLTIHQWGSQSVAAGSSYQSKRQSQ